MPTQNLDIVIISDLHCKHPSAETGTKRTLLYSDSAYLPSQKNPVAAALDLIRKESIRADILLCPGDITDQADKQGLVTGWSYLEEIQKALGARILAATVGNHDVNSRKVGGSLPFEFLTSFKDSYPLSALTEDCRNLEAEAKRLFNNTDSFALYEFDKILLLVYNSSSSHIDSTEGSKSSISDLTLNKMQERLNSVKGDFAFKIAMCHHHPISHRNADYADNDVIDKGDAFIDLLNKFDFQLVVHGHKHNAQLNYRNNLPIFCSGSFSSIENKIDGNNDNVFHKISLEAIKKRGKLATWIYSPLSGWGHRRDRDFPCFTGFGFFGNLDDLAHAFHQSFVEKNLDTIKFLDVATTVPDVLYLIPKYQKQFEKTLKDKYQLELLPSLGDTVYPNKISKLEL